MEPLPLTIQGRGAQVNPPNRFEAFRVEPDPDADPAEQMAPKTVFLKDTTRTILAHNDSPDVPFSISINPYRGCEHGCAYCYARNGHTFLGFSAGLDFESKIMVKLEAAKLLREELAKPSYKPERIALSGVTDCYQPVERRLRLTRGLLEVLRDFRNPVGLITKNHLITRDVDLLAEMAAFRGAVAMLSITTLDAQLSAKLEPRASAPRRRLAAVETLAKAGVPVGVMVAPVIPGLTDHEIPAILQAAAGAGARFSGCQPVRLPGDVAVVFEDWLGHHFPERAKKILNRLRSMHGGKVCESGFEVRTWGRGAFAEQIAGIYEVAARRAGLDGPMPETDVAQFRRPATLANATGTVLPVTLADAAGTVLPEGAQLRLF